MAAKKPIPQSVAPSNSGYSEEQLKNINIGELRPLNGQIILSKYNPDWPTNYTALADRIDLVLQEKVLQLQHVGSTAVPGLVAKPIIDMLLVVADSSQEQDYVAELEALGFMLTIREPSWYQHRLLKLSKPAANLHVFSLGCEEIQRMLAFRDWLIKNPTDRNLYQVEKLKLAKKNWKHTQNYADAKTGIISEIQTRMSSAKN